MEKKKTNPAVQEWGRYMKTKMFFARIIGIIFCAVCIAALALLYLKVFTSYWTPVLMITFSMAFIFVANSFLQNVKRGKTWQTVNLVLGLICFVAVITFIVIAYVRGELVFGF